MVFIKNSNVYELIKQSDVHVTVYSTCAIEALALGKPNVLVDIDGQTTRYLGKSLKDNPFTKIVNEEEEFYDNIISFENLDELTIKKTITSEIKPNYKENIKLALNV